jgi:hypothetical protein
MTAMIRHELTILDSTIVIFGRALGVVACDHADGRTAVGVGTPTKHEGRGPSHRPQVILSANVVIRFKVSRPTRHSRSFLRGGRVPRPTPVFRGRSLTEVHESRTLVEYVGAGIYTSLTRKATSRWHNARSLQRKRRRSKKGANVLLAAGVVVNALVGTTSANYIRWFDQALKKRTLLPSFQPTTTTFLNHVARIAAAVMNHVDDDKTCRPAPPSAFGPKK